MCDDCIRMCMSCKETMGAKSFDSQSEVCRRCCRRERKAKQRKLDIAEEETFLRAHGRTPVRRQPSEESSTSDDEE